MSRLGAPGDEARECHAGDAMNVIESFAKTYNLPAGYKVEFIADLVVRSPISLQAAWTPTRPDEHTWPRLRSAYAAARDDYLQHLARKSGVRIAVVAP